MNAVKRKVMLSQISENKMVLMNQFCKFTYFETCVETFALFPKEKEKKRKSKEKV